MSNENDCDVIKLIPRTDSAMPMSVRKPYQYKGCKHLQTLVCEETHTVTCKDCDAPVDPVLALLRIAQSWDVAVDKMDHLRKEIGRLVFRVAELKRDEHNTRARIKRLKKKTVRPPGDAS